MLALAATCAEAAPEGHRDDSEVPFLDMIPAISQVKSLGEWIFRDLGYASRTAKNFLNDGIGASQLRSLYYLATGDFDQAIEIQKKFGRSVAAGIDYVPIIGHIKSGIELLNGNQDQSFKTFGKASWPVTLPVNWIFGKSPVVTANPTMNVFNDQLSTEAPQYAK